MTRGELQELMPTFIIMSLIFYGEEHDGMWLGRFALLKRRKAFMCCFMISYADFAPLSR